MKKLLPVILLFATCAPARNLEVTPPAGAVREQMLVTIRPMGFAISRIGLTVIHGDSCTHYDCSGRLLKAPIKVWDCDHARERREHE
jgi:hypothetical protein